MYKVIEIKTGNIVFESDSLFQAHYSCSIGNANAGEKLYKLQF